MAGFPFSTNFSGPSVFVPCGIQLLREVDEAVRLGLLSVTNLGQYGDANHTSNSRHAPHYGPDGKLYICAVDFGGRDYTVMAEFFRYLYKRGDKRVFAWGFCQRGDGRGITWTNGEWKWTGNDFGHCHLDFAMATNNIGGRDDRRWWVSALNDTSSWGLIQWLKTGQVGLDDDNIKPEGFLMALNDTQQTDILNAVTRMDAALKQLKPNHIVELYKSKLSPNVYVAQPGRFWHAPEGYPALLQARGLAGEIVVLEGENEVEFLRQIYTGVPLPRNSVDTKGSEKFALPAKLSQDDLASVVAAVVTLLKK